MVVMKVDYMVVRMVVSMAEPSGERRVAMKVGLMVHWKAAKTVGLMVEEMAEMLVGSLIAWMVT